MVSKLLERASSEAAKLSEDDQRALAEWILEEIQSEQRWQEAFALSQSELGQLAGEDRDEFRAKKTQSLDELVLRGRGPPIASDRISQACPGKLTVQQAGLTAVQAANDDKRGAGCCPLRRTGEWDIDSDCELSAPAR